VGKTKQFYGIRYLRQKNTQTARRLRQPAWKIGSRGGAGGTKKGLKEGVYWFKAAQMKKNVHGGIGS